ncbi:hypothetical protein TRIUR3_17036 [Triticum urartu]|uniref:Uncharacterized protein n=2 Tax=Triticum TaxID=4564 RepID=A0A9R1P8Q6_TRITD|nr:hypothetical protein TRIUR3_17036 [Triticum urartu]VAH38884.1 unnamed protein product [Triticum turgidum subsp. durum]
MTPDNYLLLRVSITAHRAPSLHCATPPRSIVINVADRGLELLHGDAFKKEEPAARLAYVRTEEKKDSEDAATMPLEGMKPGGGVAIQQGGDPGTVPSGSGEHAKEESGEHGKEGSSSTSKEGEKSAKSCLTKEECHKKRLLCGKGCTLSAHAKCAAKCSKSCIATC